MDHNGFDYIIMVKGCKDIVSKVVSKVVMENRGTFEDEWSNTMN